MKARYSDGGYVLVTVLGVMLVLSSLIAASSLVAHAVLRGARIQDAEDRLDALSRGGLELTAYQIFTLKLPPAAVDGRAIRFDGGAVTPHVTDEGGRIDVNGSDPALLAGALRGIGLDTRAVDEIAARVVVARGKPTPSPGPPSRSTDPSAAPQAASSRGSAKPGTLPSQDGGDAAAPNPIAPLDPVVPRPMTGFRSVKEFLAFAGLDRDDAAALSSVLTVQNPDGRLNVLAAGRAALLALPGLSAVAVDALMAERRSALRSGEATLKSTLDPQKNYVKFEGGPCYRVRLDARDTLGHVAWREAVIAAGTDASDPFYILDWE